MNGRPTMPPSPPHSVARSSTAASMHSVGGGPGRKYSTQLLEDQLQEHHRVLKDFLAQSLREDRGYQPHNRARDKLLRLSQIQFQELSTDVYDELQRRQDEATLAQDPTALPTRVPKFLLPKNNFHPKRNQARQKLSTLASKKFRELATDVLFELERRNPRFTGAENVRGGSPTSTIGSRGGGMTVGVPPYGAQGRRPSAASPPYSPGVFDDGERGIPPPPINGDFGGRPQPKTFHADTMVPNKSTMVEDDDDQSADDEEAFDLEGRTTARSSRRATNMSSAMRMRDSNFVAENQAQISRLEQRINELEEQMRHKDDELRQSRSEAQESQQAVEQERSKNANLTSELERRVQSAEQLNASLQREVDTMKANNEQLERELQASAGSNEWQSRYEELEKEYHERQKLTEDVRQQAAQSLQEMRILADRTHEALDHEENLMQRVSQLETQVDDWKSRFVKAQAQSRTMQATSRGLSINSPNAAGYAQSQGFSDPKGLIRDVSVTKFQIAIDEFLHVARSENPVSLQEHMSSVVKSVRTVSEEIDVASTKDPQDVIKKRRKLRAQIVTTCNNFVSTSRSFANAQGLSPVSLVDAATANLTSAVIDLIKIAKVRPTPAGELQDDDHALA